MHCEHCPGGWGSPPSLLGTGGRKANCLTCEMLRWATNSLAGVYSSLSSPQCVSCPALWEPGGTTVCTHGNGSSGVIPPQPVMPSGAVAVGGDHNEGKEEKLGTPSVRSKLKLGEEWGSDGSFSSLGSCPESMGTLKAWGAASWGILNLMDSSLIGR